MSTKNEFRMEVYVMIGFAALLLFILSGGPLFEPLTKVPLVVGIWAYLVIAVLAVITLTTFIAVNPLGPTLKRSLFYLVYYLVIGIMCLICMLESYNLHQDWTRFVITATYIVVLIVSAGSVGSMLFRLTKLKITGS